MNNQRTEPIHIRTTPQTVEKLEAIAQNLSMSKTAVVQMALNEFFARHALADRTQESKEVYRTGGE